MMAFDHCPAYFQESNLIREAMERTLRWAKRSKEAISRCYQQGINCPHKQWLFGIGQGGTDLKMRSECIKVVFSQFVC